MDMPGSPGRDNGIFFYAAQWTLAMNPSGHLLTTSGDIPFLNMIFPQI